MTRLRSSAAFLTGCTLLFVVLFYVQVQLEQQNAHAAKLQNFIYLPDGKYLRVATLGYRHAVADLLLIRAIQVMGERRVPSAAGPWLVHLFDVITTLDPQFVTAYKVGGIGLATLFPLYNESNTLLEKGMRYNPDVWELPFLAGVTYYFNLSDDLKAAECFATAARVSGAPAYLPGLAARLFVSAQSPDAALDFLSDALSRTTDSTLKQVFERRFKEVTVERDLFLLEKAIQHYRESVGEAPKELQDLVRRRILRDIPVEPFGGHYIYDPNSLSVHSSIVKERMSLYVRRGTKT
jgi:tetratricopeptide (TPR) repeat protein